MVICWLKTDVVKILLRNIALHQLNWGRKSWLTINDKSLLSYQYIHIIQLLLLEQFNCPAALQQFTNCFRQKIPRSNQAARWWSWWGFSRKDQIRPNDPSFCKLYRYRSSELFWADYQFLVNYSQNWLRIFCCAELWLHPGRCSVMAPVLSAGVTTSSRVFLSLLLVWEGETSPSPVWLVCWGTFNLNIYFCFFSFTFILNNIIWLMLIGPFNWSGKMCPVWLVIFRVFWVLNHFIALYSHPALPQACWSVQLEDDWIVVFLRQ